jgi:hypothetical protein
MVYGVRRENASCRRGASSGRIGRNVTWLPSFKVTTSLKSGRVAGSERVNVEELFLCYYFTRPVYKPHSVRQALLAPAIIYLGYASPHSSSGLPGALTPRMRNAGSEQLPWTSDGDRMISHLQAICPCLALLPMRVAWPPPLPEAPVVSYTTFSPSLPALSPKGNAALAVCFCGPIRQVTGRRPAYAPGVTRHRALWSADFPLKRCLRSAPAIARPTWQVDDTLLPTIRQSRSD